jgi:hypothetical protein
MKKLLSCFAVLLILASYSCLQAQNRTEQQQKAYLESMTPGAVHQWMAKGVGDWKIETKVWRDENATTPTLGTGTCTNTMLLGGRYLQSKHTSNFMGKPFEGIATTAYDNTKKMFFSSWIDNTGTGMFISEGTLDEKTNTITLMGKAVDLSTGKDYVIREVHKHIDDNTMIVEYYVAREGKKEYKSMEFKFTRM